MGNGAEVCINGPDHLIKMTTAPMYVKTSKTSSVVILKLYKICINDGPRLTLTSFTEMSKLIFIFILVSCLLVFYGKNF